MIGAVLCGLIAVSAAVIGVMQLCEKGALLNNTYIYASEKQRETMDKSPYYRQSGVAFLLIALIFALNAAELWLRTGWLFFAVIGVAIVTVVYAIASTVSITKNR